MSDRLERLHQRSETARDRYHEALTVEQQLYRSRHAGHTQQERDENQNSWLTQHRKVMDLLREYREMQHETQEQTELEHYWREQSTVAKLDLDAARAQVESIRDSCGVQGPDGAYAYASALHRETAALIEYSRVLRIYTDLMVHGRRPDDSDERRVASASGE